jgi:hypothetical protein
VVGLAWSGAADHVAVDDTGLTLQRALAAFAVARGLNGVISVAQGTELAIQPVGVGVSVTAGEILDPLNDLVEDFSWLALAASVSLGAQLLLSEVMVNLWTNALLTAAALAALAALWLPPAAVPGPGATARALAWRSFVLLAFVRFLFTAIALTTAWADQAVLAERQQAALQEIELTQARIEALQDSAPAPTPPAEAEASVLERFGAFFDDRRQALNVRAQLDALTARVEDAVEQIVQLIVVFLVQTVLVPVAALVLSVWAFRWLWRWSWQPARRPVPPL